MQIQPPKEHSSAAARQLMEGLNNFVQRYHISTKRCDIFEEALLHLAGISNQPEYCNYHPEYHYERVVFEIYGISKKDSKKFLDYFHKQGDTTAKITSYDKDMRFYEMDVDAAVLYNTIFPQFKKLIREDWAINDPKRIQKYQEQSKAMFATNEEPQKSSRNLFGLFFDIITNRSEKEDREAALKMIDELKKDNGARI